MSGGNTFGLSASARAGLLGMLGRAAAPLPAREAPSAGLVSHDRWQDLPGQREMTVVSRAAEALGIPNLFFRSHDGVAGTETSIDGVPCRNFASYDYLGLNGDPRITAAAARAIEAYGTSVSASRMVSGERPVHRRLEAAIARFYGVEDCVAMVSGHATNVTVIGQLMTEADLILHDQLAHNSVVQGAALSGARRQAFAHNDLDSARRLIAQQRRGAKRALIVIEGHYSMDGDVPDLAGFVDLARDFDAWLMVDEAHSLGVLGATGRGIAEAQGVDPHAVDIWMGTLSKTLVSCGGYIAGNSKLIDYLRYAAPGFVYSVGMPPASAAAAEAALGILTEEPERVGRLNANAARFLASAKACGLDTGTSIGAAIVPIVTGSSVKAGRLAYALFQRGINIQPILYPAVPERAARLRFFLSAAHTEAQIEEAVTALALETARL